MARVGFIQVRREPHLRSIDEARYNLAGEYNKGRSSESPELGYPSISLDEYVYLVKAFSLMAQTFDRSPLTVQQEIEEALSGLGD
jgi:hypothetical protein